RQQRLYAFKADDSNLFAFLLTTRSGGIGVNLLLGLTTQASARVDPETRCGIMPFRRESMELAFYEEDDDEEEKKIGELVDESKNRGVTTDMKNTLNALLDKSGKVGAKLKRSHMSGHTPNDITVREFPLLLRQVDIAGKVIDLAFLDG
ncbi:hypothetical protein GN958_ATG16515, partial [Phytophthora infestans]